MEIFAIALKHKFATNALSNAFTFYTATLKLHLFYWYLWQGIIDFTILQRL